MKIKSTELTAITLVAAMLATAALVSLPLA